MSNRKNIVIVGATSAIAEHCARLWIQGAAADLTLVGRDTQRLERVAADLRARSPQSAIRVVQTDLLDPAAIQSAVDGIAARGRIDIALIAHGSLPDQAECQQDLQACRQALEINAISPTLYAQAFAGHMEKADHGTLAIIGSVAGDRGRKTNYVYGAAKALVTRCAEGLQHRLAATRVKVVLIKPGPTDTPMTAHLKGQGAKLASAESVAQQIVKAVEAGKPVVYAPAKWLLIMTIIRLLPRAVFNKLNI